LTVAGIRRDRAAEQDAFDDSPLHDFRLVHREAYLWETAVNWPTYLVAAPRLGRANRVVHRTRKARVARHRAPLAPERLTAALRSHAAEIGVSALGIAAHDPKYTYAEYAGCEAGNRVVVLIVEEHPEAARAIPSLPTNRATADAEAESLLLGARIARFLQRRGYRSHAHTLYELAMIPYAVQAGLGQLGLNGQLLTPYAGSRCRLAVVTTDAPLDIDEPVDYGITAICDACQVCVRRCPAGAIRVKRKPHRGIEKAKVNLERCFPTVTQAIGCAVCTKVCPVQRYGLDAVLERFEAEGTIIGKGSDQLESYRWPPDDRVYRTGERPKLVGSFIRPERLSWDPARFVPSDAPGGDQRVPDR
jgi:ferredoxin